jgi:hypothetical protein
MGLWVQGYVRDQQETKAMVIDVRSEFLAHERGGGHANTINGLQALDDRLNEYRARMDEIYAPMIEDVKRDLHDLEIRQAEAKSEANAKERGE